MAEDVHAFYLTCLRGRGGEGAEGVKCSRNRGTS